jgi:hypothetical protein
MEEDTNEETKTSAPSAPVINNPISQETRDKLTYTVTTTVTITLCLVIVAMVGALIAGLFVSNDIVDNTEIFKMIGPAFQTIIGAFIGLLAGIKLSKD